MDSIVVDDALSDYLERDWPVGLDNEGLDISQLDSFINDDSPDHDVYLDADLGTVGEMRGLSVPRPDTPTRQGLPTLSHNNNNNNNNPGQYWSHVAKQQQQQQHYNHEHQNPSEVPLNNSVSSNNSSSSSSGVIISNNSNSSSSGHGSINSGSSGSSGIISAIINNTNNKKSSSSNSSGRGSSVSSNNSREISITPWEERNSKTSNNHHQYQQQEQQQQHQQEQQQQHQQEQQQQHQQEQQYRQQYHQYDQQQPQQQYQQQQQGSISAINFGLSHPLPESPPDSGSEPPYSPPDPQHLSPQPRVGLSELLLNTTSSSSGAVLSLPASTVTHYTTANTIQQLQAYQQQHDNTQQYQQQHNIPEQHYELKQQQQRQHNQQQPNISTNLAQQHKQQQHLPGDVAMQLKAGDAKEARTGGTGYLKGSRNGKKRKMHDAPLPPARDIKQDPDTCPRPSKLLQTLPSNTTIDITQLHQQQQQQQQQSTTPTTPALSTINDFRNTADERVINIIESSNNSSNNNSTGHNSTLNITSNSVNTTINKINNITMSVSNNNNTSGRGSNNKNSISSNTTTTISSELIINSSSNNIPETINNINNNNPCTIDAHGNNHHNNNSTNNSNNSNNSYPYSPTITEESRQQQYIMGNTRISPPSSTNTTIVEPLVGPGSGGGDVVGNYHNDSQPQIPGYNHDNAGFQQQQESPGYQCIRFSNFQATSWNTLCDHRLAEIAISLFRVDADKGFNFSNPDDCFVCQKKNHFQVTVHVQASSIPQFVRSPDGIHRVDGFSVHFYGVKSESPQQMIRVEQSQSDRSKRVFHPVPMEVLVDQSSKLTVGRMHFSETTSNNMRKKGKPNPEQRYFNLVVALEAVSGDNAYTIVAKASEKIIVRASNPGQFESDVDYSFQRGSVPESVFHMGKVGVNTDRPDEALTVHGNIRITGQILQPSDRRAKKDIIELDTQEQLRNVRKLRVVQYEYDDIFARTVGLDNTRDTGVIAQEVEQVLPDAVRNNGDLVLIDGKKIENFLLVNKERIFMENVGAVKELCKVTGNLENRIDELERINNKITKISHLRRQESHRSTASSVSNRTSNSLSGLSSCSIRLGENPYPKKTQIKKGSLPSHKLFPSKGSGVGGGQASSKGYTGSSTEHCNNKTLQLVTIILVCVMAMCLVSMATVYIIDYLERRSGGAVGITTDSSTSDTTLSHTTSIPLNFTSLSSSTHTSLSSTTIFITSSTSPSLTTTSFTIPPSSTDDSSTGTTTSLTSVVFTTLPSFSSTEITVPPFQPVRPPVIGRPDGCVVVTPTDPQCQIHCCTTRLVLDWPPTSTPQRDDHHSISPTSTLALTHSTSTVSPSTMLPVTRRYMIYGRSAPSLEPVSSSLDSALITNKLTTNEPNTFSDATASQPLTINFKPVPSKKAISHHDTYSRLLRHRVRQQSYVPTSSRKIKQTISRRDVSKVAPISSRMIKKVITKREIPTLRETNGGNRKIALADRLRVRDGGRFLEESSDIYLRRQMELTKEIEANKGEAITDYVFSNNNNFMKQRIQRKHTEDFRRSYDKYLARFYHSVKPIVIDISSRSRGHSYQNKIHNDGARNITPSTTVNSPLTIESSIAKSQDSGDFHQGLNLTGYRTEELLNSVENLTAVLSSPTPKINNFNNDYNNLISSIIMEKLSPFSNVSVNHWTITRNDSNLANNETGSLDGKRQRRSIGLSAPNSSSGHSGKSGYTVNECMPIPEIMELNSTINHLYCLNTSQQYFEQCSNGSTANLTYGIPVSMFMQHVNLTLKFTFPGITCDKTMHYCSVFSPVTFPLEKCPTYPDLETPPVVVELNAHQMALVNIGRWKRVGYKFRMMTESDDSSTNPCMLGSSAMGGTFVEFNFFFYRVCDA